MHSQGVGRAKGRERYTSKEARCAGRVLMHALTLLPHSHKSTGIFNPYWPGRDKTSLEDRKETGARKQKHKQPQTRRAASALLIPIFCFIHNHLFLISSSEKGLSLERQQCPMSYNRGWSLSETSCPHPGMKPGAGSRSRVTILRAKGRESFTSL